LQNQKARVAKKTDMKTKLILISSAVVIFAACRATKKSTTSVAPVASTSAAAPAPALITIAPQPQNSFEATKFTHGVFPPRNEELTAIQKKYPDATLAILQQGFQIYTVGKCINCHGSKNIYKRDVEQWKDIIDDMAQRAKITDTEKDAVYKYVLAIKAAQTK
jgi:hypothetical protein